MYALILNVKQDFSDDLFHKGVTSISQIVSFFCGRAIHYNPFTVCTGSKPLSSTKIETLSTLQSGRTV